MHSSLSFWLQIFFGALCATFSVVASMKGAAYFAMGLWLLAGISLGASVWHHGKAEGWRKQKRIGISLGAAFIFLIVPMPFIHYWLPSTTNSPLPTHYSRIVVSKFVIRRFDTQDSAKTGYQIDLHMINRGNIPGYAPVNNFSFWSVEKAPSDTEIDKEMDKVIKLALQQSPVRIQDREQIEVGADYYTLLPSGLTPEAYTMISSGQKTFYLFVALTYYDDSLPMGQFWVSEFCAWQSKDLSYFQLCKGHNKTWLSKN
jgi:hypothetical protein